MKDLFLYPELQPTALKDILTRYESCENDYDTCKALQSEVEAIGYTFEFYLDAEPHNLRKMLDVDKYNGKTYFEVYCDIQSSHLLVQHKREYMKNVVDVIMYQRAGVNLHLIEPIKNTNHRLFKLYHPNFNTLTQ